MTACTGQKAVLDTSKKEHLGLVDFSKVDTVRALGKSVMLVYQDKKDNYWFGSWEDGLYKYDGQTILHFSTKNGLPNNRIDEIQEDNSGNVYFNSSDGIVKYDGETFKLLPLSDSDSSWQMKPDDLFFKNGWNSASVFRCDGDYLYKLKLPKTKLGEEYIFKNPTHPNPYTVYSIYKDNKGNFWFGTGGLGAFRYNGKSFDWILERDILEIFNGPMEGSNGVRSIIEDRDGYFWFNAMFRYQVYATNQSEKNNSDSMFYRKEISIGSLDGKPDSDLNEYLSVAKDKNQNLWFATYTQGVYQYDGKDLTHYVVKDGSKAINLFSIYIDNAGQIWLGTNESGAYRFNGKSFERFKL